MSDITREDAVKWLTNLREDCGRYQDLWPYGEALEQIIKLLDTDVAPVRHGRWYKNDQDKLLMRIRCSICNKAIYSENHFAYCPNCGARMDGDDNEID